MSTTPQPKVQCLTATYGRFSRLQRAVTCFLDQDYDNKELLILNNHPAPLTTDLPGIRIFNEPLYPTLGHCRERLAELSDADYCRTWDDDDFYMPWTLSQGIENIKDFVAWKPTRSWFVTPKAKHRLMGNAMEASILYKGYVGKKYGFRLSGGDEHVDLLHGFGREGGLKDTEMGVMSSYIYRWGFGEWHISGSLGSSNLEIRTATWKERNQDTGDGKKIERIDIKEYHEALLKDVLATFTLEEYWELANKYADYGVRV